MNVESGEELVSLIAQCFSDKGLPKEDMDEETLSLFHHQRHERFASRAKLASKLVQNDQLPIYHRGLAARLLACTLSRAPGPAIAEQVQNTLVVVTSVVDIMNKASSGKSYAGAPPLTSVDGHRVGVNCAAALAQIHDPGATSSHHVLNLEGARMIMAPYPEFIEDEYYSNQPESREYLQTGGSRNTNDSMFTSGTGFWTGLDRTSTRDRQDSRGTRGFMESQGSGYSNNSLSRVHTAMTGTTTTSVVTEGVFDYEKGSRPDHRPQTQFSALAGDMGLYDTDVNREMHVLDMQMQRENGVDDGIDDGKNRGGGMLNALTKAVGLIDGHHHNNNDDEHRVKRRLRTSKQTQPTTYDEFIRVMLATPAQGAPGQSFSRNNPNLAELSHAVRQNWTAMPHYLEAVGVLENYPMHAHQQTVKVQRAFQRAKTKELHAIELQYNKRSESNTGMIFGSDPSGLGTRTLSMLNFKETSNFGIKTKNRRSTGMLDPRALGYTKSMMWFPKPRLMPAGSSSPTSPTLASPTSLTSPTSLIVSPSSGLRKTKEETTEQRRQRLSLKTWQGRVEPKRMPLHLSLDIEKIPQHQPNKMAWGEERSGERDDYIVVENKNQYNNVDEILTERAAEVIEERVLRAPLEIQRLDHLVSRIRGQQLGISQLLYSNIDQLRLELPMKFLLSLKSSNNFPEFNVQVIRDRAYLMLAAWGEEIRLRALAAALVPWWQLVVRQRATEYRAGVGVRLLKEILYRLTLRLMSRKYFCWLRWTAWQRHKQRNTAALVIQAKYRGYKGRMEFLELLRRHLAAIPIQTCWRRVWATTVYRIDLAHIIVTQRIARGLIVRRIVREWHRSAIPFQSVFRMYPRRIEYLIVAEAIVKAQTVYRAWIARKMFYHVFELRIRKFEVEMTMAVSIQRCWRGVAPRRLVKEKRRVIKEREAAALHIQNWWYRINDMFASFFLMRLLAVQEQQGEDKQARTERQKRLAAVALVQRRVRGWKARKRVQEIKRKGGIATQIQKIYRGRSTRAAFHRYKQDLYGAIAIQRMYRAMSLKRNNAARVLQRMYLVGAGGIVFDLEKLKQHIKAKAEAMEQERIHQERIRYYNAALLVQHKYRSRKAKLVVKRLRATIYLQAFFRMCLARAERTRRYLVHCHETGMKYVVIPSLREAMARACRHVHTMQKNASTIIQTQVRMMLAKQERLSRADYLVRSTASSIRVQRWWRNRLSDVVVANFTEAAACAKGNLFKAVPRGDTTKHLHQPSTHDLIVSAVKRINRYFSIDGDHKGMDVASLLLRLGLGDHAAAVKKMLHASEKKIYAQSGILRPVSRGVSARPSSRESPAKKKRTSIQKKATPSQPTPILTGQGATSQAAATAVVVEGSQEKGMDMVYSKEKGETDAMTKVTKKKEDAPPLPIGFPDELPPGQEFNWLRVEENGEMELLKSILKLPEHKHELMCTFAKESPRALQEASDKAGGKKVRAKVQTKKITLEDGSTQTVSINLDKKADQKYGQQCIELIESLITEKGEDEEQNRALSEKELNLKQQQQVAVAQGFQIITDKYQMKKIAAKEFKKSYPRAANRAGRFGSNVPLNCTSLLQLKAYLNKLGPSGASRAFDFFDHLERQWPGWEGKGKAEPGLLFEQKRWDGIRIRRAFELVQMATERACSLLPEDSSYAMDLRQAMHKAKRQWHWRRPWVQESNLLYQCPLKVRVWWCRLVYFFCGFRCLFSGLLTLFTHLDGALVVFFSWFSLFTFFLNRHPTPLI